MSRVGNKSKNTIVSIERMFKPQTANQHIEKARLVFNSTLSSTVGGFITTTLSLNPNAGSEWASYAALYDEFRVRGIRITLISTQQYSVTAKNGIVGVVYDNDDSVALTSLAAALEYDTAQIIPSVFQHTITKENKTPALQLAWCRPNSGTSTNIPWYDVGTPSASPGSIKFYSDTLSVSTDYFHYVLEYFVEFRGRR